MWALRWESVSINQTRPVTWTWVLWPETHFGFKNIFAHYDWASGRACVTVKHGTNEIPNQHQAMLELKRFTPSPPPPPPPSRPHILLTLRLALLKRGHEAELKNEQNSISAADGHSLGCVLCRSGGKWPMKYSFLFKYKALVTHM